MVTYETFNNYYTLLFIYLFIIYASRRISIKYHEKYIFNNLENKKNL